MKYILISFNNYFSSDEQEKSLKAYRILGIDFAPLTVPMERRLQTMAMAFFVSSFILSLFSTIPAFMYMLIFTEYWYIPLIFAAWIVYDRNTPYQGGWKYVSSFILVY